MAEAVRVGASLGPLAAKALEAPAILPPFGPAEPLVVMVPFGTASHADVMAAIHAGEALQVRIDFADGTSDPEPAVRCFAFRLEAVDGTGGGTGCRTRRRASPGRPPSRPRRKPRPPTSWPRSQLSRSERRR
jgi:hypothetical protein